MPLFSPRNLVATDGPWVPPTDGNYSTWKTLVDEKLGTFCSSPMTLNGVASASSAGKSFFDNSFYGKSSDALESAMADNDIGSYVTSELVAWMVMFFLALIFAVFACVLSCCVFKKVRPLGVKVTCGKCFHDRPRETLLSVPNWHWVIFIVLFFLTGSVGVISFSATALAAGANMLSSFDSMSCSSWQSVDGYFFGAQQFNESAPDDLVTDWKGTASQYEAMNELKVLVTPGEDNPLYIDINGRFQEIKEEFLAMASNSSESFLHELYMQRELKAHMKQVSETEGFRTEIIAQMIDTMDEKGLEWIEETIDTVWVGFNTMEATIEKYLSPESQLLERSFVMANSALKGIEDVDHTFAGVTYSVDNLTGGGTVTAMGAIYITWATLALILAISATVILALFLVRLFSKKDEESSLQMQKALGGVFCSYSIFLGISVMFCLIMWALTRFLGDACAVVNGPLLQDGHWEILDEEMWNHESFETNIRDVFTACMSNDGHGDVATTLGLRRETEELESEVEAVKIELRSIPEKLLLEYKIYLTTIVRGLLEDHAVFWTHFRDDAGRPNVYPGARYIIPEPLTDPEKTPRRVMCSSRAFAHLPDVVPTLKECINQDFVLNIYGSNQLMDLINLEEGVGRKYCAQEILQEWGDEYCEEGAQMLTSKTDVENDVNIQADAAAVELVTNLETKNMWLDAIMTSVELEKMMVSRVPNDLGCNTNPQKDRCRNACPEELIDSNNTCSLAEFRRHLFAFNFEFGWYLERDVVGKMAEITYQFIEEDSIAVTEQLLVMGYDALANFNCQFVGNHLGNYVAADLCVPFTSQTAMMVISGIVVFICCTVAAVLLWKLWHHVRDLNVEGGPGGANAASETAKMMSEEEVDLAE